MTLIAMIYQIPRFFILKVGIYSYYIILMLCIKKHIMRFTKNHNSTSSNQKLKLFKNHYELKIAAVRLVKITKTAVLHIRVESSSFSLYNSFLWLQ